MPPFRRMGRPGLVGTMARTAVVAGTATAVAGGVSHHQQNKYAAQDQAAYDQQMAEQQAAQQAQMESQAELAQMQAAQAQQAAPAVIDLTGELEKLAALKQSGALTDEEFAAAKAHLLNA